MLCFTRFVAILPCEHYIKISTNVGPMGVRSLKRVTSSFQPSSVIVKGNVDLIVLCHNEF